MTKFHTITEDQLDLMHFIEKDSNASQRLIAKNIGFSIGKVNYCIKALIDIGFIKVINFNKSSQKINYAYILTPKGIQEKTSITKQFILKKKQEYDKLNSYINE
ncbi:MarR family EPS-associated transcriptional regulator [Gammaproteobacteria bacterium]|nr:MarR family EPS-associated transcriptional regulator [Gammaproteobacteria bacterium]